MPRNIRYNQKHGFGYRVEMGGQNGMKWYRTQYADGFATPWTFVVPAVPRHKVGTIELLVFGSGAPKQPTQSAEPYNPEVQKLKGIDWSGFTEQPTVINGYRITVEKLGPNTK